MGLLDKALTVDSITKGFSPQIESMVNSLQSSGDGLDFPSVFFTGLTKELVIKKGALLLPEEDGKYVPWSVVGFDQTTSRRIRIPDTLLTTLKSLSSFDYVELNDTEIDEMKEFFSFREYSVTEKIIISPIVAVNEILALVLISESELLEQKKENIRNILESLSSFAAPLLQSRKDKVMSKLERSSRTGEISEAINSLIENNVKESFMLISLSINSLLEVLVKKDSGAIRYRLVQDMQSLMSTMLSNKGNVYNKGTENLILLIKGERKEEAELLVHQIGLSLSLFFKIDRESFSLPYEIITYPHNGETASELISKL